MYKQNIKLIAHILHYCFIEAVTKFLSSIPCQRRYIEVKEKHLQFQKYQKLKPNDLWKNAFGQEVPQINVNGV